MLKQKDSISIDVPIDQFTRFNEELFHDDTIPPDQYTPLANPDHHHISSEELTGVLEHRYKATKSRGLSKLPP
jgi:hypothetical protein